MKQFFSCRLRGWLCFFLFLSASMTTMAQVSPAHVVVGYWQDWGATTDSPPFVPLRNIDSRYNVIDLAFASTGGDFATLSFAPNNETVAAMQSDIAFLQSQGRHVLLSIGGENGTLTLTSSAQKQAFITSLEALLDQYNLDGFDLDLEGGTTLVLDNGDNNFMSPTTPKVVNLISACQQVISYRQGKGRPCWLSMAPETFYVETAFANAYSPLVGAYLPIIYGLRNQLTFLQPQFYNTGSVTGLDGKNYNEATPDFTVAMAEMLLTGFAINGLNGGTQVFPALRPDQVVIGLPSTQAAAPSGGFYSNAQVTQALNYLTKGVSFGGAYKLRNPAGYPGLRGVMNWSISYDETTGYAFAANIYNFFNGSTPGNAPPTVTLTAPASGASFIAPASVTLQATAADADGSVTKVDFFNGTTLLGESTRAPYQFSWTSIGAGSYSLTAVATDNGGASTTSTPVTITVQDTSTSGGGGTGGGNCAGVPTYQPYPAVYNLGDKVVYNGKLYQSTSNSLFNVTPGTADWWWTPLGSCTASTTKTALSTRAAQVNTTAVSLPLAVYPNPVTNTAVQLQISAQAGERLYVTVSSVTGGAPLIIRTVTAGVQGPQLISIDFSSLPAGLWLLSVRHPGTGRVETTKIVKP